MSFWSMKPGLLGLVKAGPASSRRRLEGRTNEGLEYGFFRMIEQFDVER